MLFRSRRMGKRAAEKQVPGGGGSGGSSGGGSGGSGGSFCPADRMWSPGEGNGRPLQYSSFENPMNSMKRQNHRILTEELPRSVVAPYATGDQWRNNSRKNEGMEPKQKQYPAVDVTGDR